MKAILHLGTEKTGTSTVQQVFAKSRKVLMDQGFYFMHCTGRGNDRKLVAYCYDDDQYDVFHKSNSINNFDDKVRFEEKFVKDFEEEINSLPDTIHTVIFSSEHFQSRLVKESHHEKLKELLGRFFDEFILISYLRPQVEMAVSHYSTYLKTNGVKSLDEYMKRCHPENYYFDYWRFLSSWENSFPGQGFKVRVFDRDSMVEGDVVTDICRAIGVDEGKLERVDNANESVQPTGQELLRIINSNMPLYDYDGGVNFKRVSMVNMISKIYAGSGKKPEKTQAVKIQDGFSDINEKVREHWFPERKELFSINYDKFDKQDPVQWDVVSFFESFLEEVSSLNPGKMAGVTPGQIDKMRDAAVYIEDYDMETALNIMTVAMKLRPEGEFIKKKVKAYSNYVNKG